MSNMEDPAVGSLPRLSLTQGNKAYQTRLPLERRVLQTERASALEVRNIVGTWTNDAISGGGLAPVSLLGVDAIKGDGSDSFFDDLPPAGTTTNVFDSVFRRSDVAATSNTGSRGVYPPPVVPPPATPKVAYSMHHHLAADENDGHYGDLTGNTSGAHLQKASIFIM